ncbi:MAG: DUF992 domain-containing protein [Rhodobacteraceae bacterium]|nr:DUF992 domain-containing protein [Paracoccaceae bacterium]
MKFLALAIPALFTAFPVFAAEHKGIELGVLSCNLTEDSNAIVYSEADYECTLQSSNNAISDGLYHGQIKRLGVDLEWKADETLVWAVIALTENTKYGPIEGDYIGAGADLAAGFGLGANVLVGGLGKSFALQPVSVSAESGIGLTAGIEELKLNYEGEVLN